MNYSTSHKLFLPALLSIAMVAARLALAEDVIRIERTTDEAKLIPISVSGFSGEAASTLKFDLEVMGCRLVEGDAAQYLVNGSNNGNVQGTLTDRISKAVLLAKAYQGGTTRVQAHALADDVIFKITGQKGIAQTKIAFKAERGASIEVYIADYDGHNPQAVTHDNAIIAAPTWVPGQFKLLYTSYRAGNPDIYAHDLGTGDRRAVARFSGLNTSAAVSPMNRKVAMILSKNGSPDLYVADLDGSNLKQLTKTKEDESSPCWSPDGQRICFASRVGGRPALYTISASGGEMRRLQTAGVGTATEPDWSPDGKTIAFTTMTRPFQICTVPASGGTVSVLGEGEDPSWAPNSRTLIIVRRTGGGRALSLLDAPTKQLKDVARVLGGNSQPAWRR